MQLCRISATTTARRHEEACSEGTICKSCEAAPGMYIHIYYSIRYRKMMLELVSRLQSGLC